MSGCSELTLLGKFTRATLCLMNDALAPLHLPCVTPLNDPVWMEGGTGIWRRAGLLSRMLSASSGLQNDDPFFLLEFTSTAFAWSAWLYQRQACPHVALPYPCRHSSVGHLPKSSAHSLVKGSLGSAAVRKTLNLH